LTEAVRRVVMKVLNEGQWDRSVRMLVGIVLVVAGWMLALNTLGVALFVIGAIAFGTGIVGWCPAYTLFGVSTVKTAAGHCPHCETGHHQN
jgi:hypothetical protein